MDNVCLSQYLKTASSLEWDEIIDSFSYHIPQQRCGWARAFEVHGDGEAFLWYCETEHLKAVDVFFISRAASDKALAFTPLSGTAMHIEERETKHSDTGFSNLQALYGNEIDRIFATYDEFCSRNGIGLVQAVFRYDAPDTYDRYRYFNSIVDIPTYIMHTGTADSVISAMHQEQRRNLKKGIRNGIQIEISDFTEDDTELMCRLYCEFIASKEHFEYYNFNDDFFMALAGSFQNYVKLVRAKDRDDHILTELLLITGDGVAEVFLLANTAAAYEQHSNALLYYELAQYAKDICPYLSLGTAARDLVRFKLHLDRNGERYNHQMQRAINK